MPYKQTIDCLGRVLSQRLGRRVDYLREKPPEKEKHILLPLFIQQNPIGWLEISPAPSQKEILKALDLTSWTLNSLENIFEKYQVSIPVKYPLLIQDEDFISLKKAHQVYENSPARSFIHCEGGDFDRSLLKEDKNSNVFLFISNLEELKKEDQLFLAHFLRTKSSRFIAASTLKARSLWPPLKECFHFLGEKASAS